MQVPIKLGATLRELFATCRLVDNEAQDADSTPTVVVYEQGSSLVYSPTVTNLATGEYEAAIVCSGGNGFEVGKEYTAVVRATIDGVDTKLGGIAFRIVAGVLEDGVNVVQWNGTNVAAPTTAGVPRVDVKAMEANVVTAAAIADGAIDLATFAADARLGLFREIRRGTAQGGSATTIQFDAGASAVDDFYNDDIVLTISGPGALQTRQVSDYVGATKTATVPTWTAADATTVFAIYSGTRQSVSIGAGSITLASFAADALLGAFGVVDSGTCQDGDPTRVRLRAGAPSNSTALVNGRILITGGTGASQMSTITSFDGTTKWADIPDEWGAPADNTSTYTVFAGDSPMAAALRTLDERPVEGSATHGDLLRGIFAMLAGKMLGLEAIAAANGVGDATYYGMDGSTVRIVVSYTANGRPVITLTQLAE